MKTDNVTTFIEWFREQFESIQSAEFSKDGNCFKKVLYVGMIDALSKTVYPRKKHRDRFVWFIRDFFDWKHCGKISLPHLERLLQRTPDPEFSDLRRFTFEIFDNWEEGDIKKLNSDPDYIKVQALWPKGKESNKPIEGVQIDFIRHDHLFYTYRNSLVHELQTPGVDIKYDGDIEPFYISITDPPEEKIISWNLVYPLRFFEESCKNSLERLKKYYIENRINPYSFFTSGNYWLEKLNW